MKYKTKLAIKKTDKTPIKKKGMMTGWYYKKGMQLRVPVLFATSTNLKLFIILQRNS